MARLSGTPGRDCPRCPRLVAFREAWRAREPDWFNAPVASFGPLDARLLSSAWRPGCAAPTAPDGRSPATMPATCSTAR